VKTATILIVLCSFMFVAPAKADPIDDCANAAGTPEGIGLCTAALAAATNDLDRAISLAARANSYSATGECEKGSSDWSAARGYFPALNDAGKEECKKK